MINAIAFRKIVSDISIGVFFLISIIFFSSYIPLQKKKTTVTKIYAIMSLLYCEKFATDGEYPYDLECFRDDQFDDKNRLIDSWGNPFYYELFDNGKEYLLLSSGKDGILFTEDDINSDLYKFRYRNK